MVALEITGWCAIGYWLSIYLMKGPFFNLAASWRRQVVKPAANEQQVLRMSTAASGSCIAGICIGYIRLPQSQKQCIYVK